MGVVFTAGARRVLGVAEQLARQLGAESVATGHLLWGLWWDESRAAEILANAGVAEPDLAQLCPLPDSLSSPLLLELPQVDSECVTAPQPPFDETVDSVLIEARRFVMLSGRASEVGSEHLLAGLLAVPSLCRDRLLATGLTIERVREEVADGTGLAETPLQADETLRVLRGPSSDETDAARMFDAAANRAREGLRVVEDAVRFGLDDAHLMRRLKEFRHRLSRSLCEAAPAGLLAARDTLADVGTAIHTAQERLRSSLGDLVTANCKRLQESLRTLEECAKVLTPEASAALEQLRYEAYVLERAIATTFVSQRRFEGRRLYLLLSDAACPRGAGPVLAEALRGGVSLVQVREKTKSDRVLREYLRHVRDVTAEAGALLIVNDRPDLAVLCGADGVHVGQDDLSLRDARRIVGPDRVVGVSTHSIEQARQAVLEGADYIGVGPVFASRTKAFTEFAGLEFVKQVAAEITLPAYAIGGIDVENVGQVVAAGLRSVAVSSAVCQSPHPGDVARDIAALLGAATADKGTPS